MTSVFSIYALNSEYKKLKAVLLYLPSPDLSVNDIYHYNFVEQVSFSKLHEEIIKLAETYQKFGVQVHFITHHTLTLQQQNQMANLIYMRDLFFMTPHGAIIANMGLSARRDEPLIVKHTLDSLNVPILKCFTKEATFEGADMLWLNEKTLIIGVGNRTKHTSFTQLKKIFLQFQISTLHVDFYHKFPQHLLGALQFVDFDCALIRDELLPEYVISWLIANNIKLIKIPEFIAQKEPQSMNIVCLAPKKIIMPSHCPLTETIYLKAGLDVMMTLDIPELIKGGGGLACTTGILARD